MVLENDDVVSKNTKEKVKSLALKAKVTRSQTSDDNNSQDRSKEDDEDDEEFNLMAINFRKFCRKGNRFRRRNRFGNGGDKFGRSIPLLIKRGVKLSQNTHK
ncbi:hypothetical protein Tco_0285234, partial [Tanacetum coccineum]